MAQGIFDQEIPRDPTDIFDDLMQLAPLPSPSDSPFASGVDETINNILEEQKKRKHDAFAEAASARAEQSRAAREAGYNAEAQTAAALFGFDQVKEIRDHAPVFYERFISNPDFSDLTAPDLNNATLLERGWDYSTDFARSMRVSARNAESSYLGVKHMMNGFQSKGDRERLEYLNAGTQADMFDIERDATGAMRNQFNPLNWPITVGEQAINLGGAYLFSQIGGGIGAAGGAILGTLGFPDLTDIVTVPLGGLTGRAVGQAAGLVAFTTFMEGGSLFNELVAERERRGEEIDYDELRMIALGGGLINGTFEALGMAMFSRVIPKSLREKLNISDVDSAVRQLFGTETGRQAASGIFRRYAASVATEGATEGFQEMVNALAVEFDAGGFGGAADVLRFMASNETLSRVAHAAFKGIQVASVLGGGAVVSSGYGSYADTATGKKQVENIVRAESTVRASEEGQLWLMRANQFAIRNKEMIESNPEQVKEYVAQVAAKTGITDVHVGAETLHNLLDKLGTAETVEMAQADTTGEETGETEAPAAPESDELGLAKGTALSHLEAAIGSNLEKLADLAASGQTVAISMHDYITHIATQEELVEALAIDTKVDVSHYTRKEVGDEIEMLKDLKAASAASEEEHNRLVVEQEDLYNNITLPEHIAANEASENPRPIEEIEFEARLDAQITQSRAVSEGKTIEEALEDRAPIVGVKDIATEMQTQAFYQSWSIHYGGIAKNTRREMDAMDDPSRHQDGSVVVPSGHGYVGEGGKSNLSALQSKLVRTTAFKDWFGDSKVVDENGEPRVLYHGRMNESRTIDFNEREAGFGVTGNLGASNYFTSSQDDALANYASYDPDRYGDISNKIEQETLRIQKAYSGEPDEFERIISEKYATRVSMPTMRFVPFRLFERDFHAINKPLQIPMREITAALDGSIGRSLAYDLNEQQVKNTMEKILLGHPVTMPQVRVLPATGEFVEIQLGGETIEALRRLNYDHLPANIVWTEKMNYPEARAIAEKTVLGTGGNVVPVFLSVENPLVLDNDNVEATTPIELRTDNITELQKQIDDGDEGMQVYLDEVIERAAEMQDRAISPVANDMINHGEIPSWELFNLVNALYRVARDYRYVSQSYDDQGDRVETLEDLNPSDVVEGILYPGRQVSGALSSFAISKDNQPWTQVEKDIRSYVDRKGGQAFDAYTGENSFAPGHFFRRVVEEMGYDGIIDRNAEAKFRGMEGLKPGDFHVVTFQGNQQKSSIDNLTFNEHTNDLFFQQNMNDEIGADLSLNEKARAARRVILEPRLQSRVMVNAIQAPQESGDLNYWLTVKRKKIKKDVVMGQNLEGEVVRVHGPPEKDGGQLVTEYKGVLGKGAKADEIEFMGLEFVLLELTENGKKSVTKKAVLEALTDKVIRIREYGQTGRESGLESIPTRHTVHGPAFLTREEVEAATDRLIKLRKRVKPELMPTFESAFGAEFAPELLGFPEQHHMNYKLPPGLEDYFESIVEWVNAAAGNEYTGGHHFGSATNVLGFNRYCVLNFPATSDKTELALEAQKAHEEIQYLHQRLDRAKKYGTPRYWIGIVRDLREGIALQDKEILRITDVLAGKARGKARGREKFEPVIERTGNEYADFIAKFSLNTDVLNQDGIVAHLRKNFADEVVPVEAVEKVIEAYRKGAFAVEEAEVVRVLEDLVRQGVPEINRSLVKAMLKRARTSAIEADFKDLKVSTTEEFKALIRRVGLIVPEGAQLISEGLHPAAVIKLVDRDMNTMSPFIINKRKLKREAQSQIKHDEANPHWTGTYQHIQVVEGDTVGREQAYAPFHEDQYLWESPETALEAYRGIALHAFSSRAGESLGGEEWALIVDELDLPIDILHGDLIRATFAATPEQIADQLHAQGLAPQPGRTAPDSMTGSQMLSAIQDLFAKQTVALPTVAPSREGSVSVKSLYIIEAQSDWHQKGRTQGYRRTPTPELLAEHQRLKDLFAEATVAEAEAIKAIEDWVEATVAPSLDLINDAMKGTMPWTDDRGLSVYDAIVTTLDDTEEYGRYIIRPFQGVREAVEWDDLLNKYVDDHLVFDYLSDELGFRHLVDNTPSLGAHTFIETDPIRGGAHQIQRHVAAGVSVPILAGDLMRHLHQFELARRVSREPVEGVTGTRGANSYLPDGAAGGPNERRGIRAPDSRYKQVTLLGITYRIENLPYIRDDDQSDDGNPKVVEESIKAEINDTGDTDWDHMTHVKDGEQYNQEEWWNDEDNYDSEWEIDDYGMDYKSQDEDEAEQDANHELDEVEDGDDDYDENEERWLDENGDVLNSDGRDAWIATQALHLRDSYKDTRVEELATKVVEDMVNNGDLRAERHEVNGYGGDAYIVEEYSGGESYYRVYDTNNNSVGDPDNDENEAYDLLTQAIMEEFEVDEDERTEYITYHSLAEYIGTEEHGIENLKGKVAEMFTREIYITKVEPAPYEPDGMRVYEMVTGGLYNNRSADWYASSESTLNIEESRVHKKQVLALLGETIDDEALLDASGPLPATDRTMLSRGGAGVKTRGDRFAASGDAVVTGIRRKVQENVPSELSDGSAAARQERRDADRRVSRHQDDNKMLGGIPEAPFSNNAMPELLIRMTIIKAITRGLKSISWSKGETAVENWGNFDPDQEIMWREVDRGRRWHIYWVDRPPYGSGRKGKKQEQIMSRQDMASMIGQENAAQVVEDYSAGNFTGTIKVKPGKVKSFLNQYNKSMVEEAATIAAMYHGKPPELRTNYEGHEAWFMDIPEALADAILDNRELLYLFQSPEGSSPADAADGERSPLGAYDPKEHKIYTTPGANASTYLHEQGHAHMHLLIRRAHKGDPDAMKDVEVLLEWFGIESIDDLIIFKSDDEATVAAKTKLHEQFADGFIMYMAEGNAPSSDLKIIFDKFRDFLVEITKRLMARADFELSDEVRDVYGKMVSNEADLSSARDVLSAHPLSQEQLGMTDAQYDRYTQLITNAIQEARRKLDEGVGKKANRVKSRAYAKRRIELTKLVNAELDEEPAFQLRSIMMTPGSQVKLNAADVEAEMKGEPRAAEIMRAVKSAYNKTGETSAHMMAEDYGYNTVYDMLRDMADSGKKVDAVKRIVKGHLDAEELADPNMARLEDLTTDEAMEAMHNASWEHTLLAEITSLEKVTGKKRAFPVRVLKVNAARMIAGMRLKDLNPGMYLRAERQAANAAIRALEKGDRDLGLIEKSRQLMNQYLYREAQTQREKADKALIKVQRYNTKKGRAGIDESYLPHIVGILSRFDLRKNAPREARDEVAATAAETRDFVAGRENDESLVNQGEAVRINDDSPIYSEEPTPWHQLSVEEFETFVESISNLVAIGKQVSTVTLNGERMDKRETAARVTDNLVDNVPERPAVIPKEGPRLSLTTYWVELRKRLNIARKIDGYKDTGAAQDILISNMSRAQGTEENRLALEFEVLRKIFSKYDLDARAMKKEHTFANGKIKMSQENILSVALNTGNEENRQRITETIGFYLRPGAGRDNDSAQNVLKDILATVTDEQWTMVQEVWDYLESYWPEVAALEERTTGVQPKRVEPVPFTTPTGRDMRGGYYPISYDPRVSDKSRGDATRLEAMQNMAGFAGSAMTAHGHAKTRVGSGGRNLKLELSVMFTHVGSVVHDLTHRETLVGLHRILRDPELAAEMQGRLGQDDYNQWMHWIQRTAAGDERAATSVEKFAGVLRGRVTIMGMGLNFSTAALQIMGLTQSQQKIGGKWVGAAMATYLANITNLSEWRGAINEKSSIMERRGETFNRDVRELSRQVSKSRKLSLWESAMFSPIVAMQSVVDGITWTASYNKAISEGETEEKAVQRADIDVALTQGSGRISDLSGVEGRSPFLKLFTTFYSFMNTMFNLSVDEYNRISQEDRPLAIKMAKSAQAVFMIYILPATLTNYVLDILIAGEEPEDEEEWLKWLGQQNMNYFVGQFPFMREAIPSGFRYSGPAGLRFFENLNRGISSATDLIPGGDQFGGDDAPELFEDPLGLLDTSDSKAIIDALGVFGPLPTVEIKRLIAGLHRIQEGETEGPMDALTGLLFRKAR